MIRRELGLLNLPLVAAIALGCGAAQSQNQPLTTPDKSAAPDATPLAGGGFALDFEIWKPESHGDPRRLTATYQWGSGEARTAEARLQNDRWHFTFPDQPKPQEIAELRLRYEFALSPADRLVISAAAREVLRGVLRAVNRDAEPPAAGAAAPSHPEPSVGASLTEASKQLAQQEPAKTLRKYGVSNGPDGLTIVLNHLGLEADDTGGWRLTESGRAALVGASKAWTANDTEAIERELRAYGARLHALVPTGEEAACQVPAGDLAQLEAAAAKAMLDACSATLQALAVANDRKRGDGQHTQRELADELREQIRKVPYPEEDVASAADELAAEFAQSRSYVAVRIAESNLRRAARLQRQRSQEDALLAGVDVAFEDAGRTEDGATLLAGAARPRRYDLATGVVYVQGLDDVVSPMLVSICFWDGCLAPDDVAWSSSHGWGRALSVDAGVRLTTLDTQDPRQSELSFLVGASFNPVTVLRLSGGLYAFENAQKPNNWNARPYVGVTVNVLNAAELLGALGLGSPPAPSTEEVK